MSKLNKSFIDKIDPPPSLDGKPAQDLYRDSALPGFGLRVGSGGTKAFFVEKRIKGRVKRITIGRYGPLTPEQARAKAIELLGEITLGKDPVSEKKAEAKRDAYRAVTLEAAFDSYLESRKDLKPGSIKNYRQCLNCYVKDWLNLRLLDISKDMVQERHSEIGSHTPSKANNTMRILRAIFNHAIERYEDDQGKPLISTNPVSRLSHNRAWYRIEKRTGHLKPHQIKAWWDATNGLHMDTSRDYLQLLLLTGLRKNEGATLTWKDVDLKNRTLTVRDTKNKDQHTLPLGPYLQAMLTERFYRRSSDWVFPSRLNDGPLVEPRTAVKRVIDLCGLEFTLHDLRRTFITIAESLDISAYALKRLANHRMANDITAGYIISDAERLRGPMEQIEKFVRQNLE